MRKHPVTSFSLTEEILAKIDEIAANRGVAKSRVAQELINAGLNATPDALDAAFLRGYRRGVIDQATAAAPEEK